MFKFLRDLGALLTTIAEMREDIRGVLRSILEVGASIRILEERLERQEARIERLESLQDSRLSRLETLETELRGFMGRVSDRPDRQKEGDYGF